MNCLLSIIHNPINKDKFIDEYFQIEIASEESEEGSCAVTHLWHY